MPATLTMPKKSKSRTTKPLAAKVVWFPNRRSMTFTSDLKDTTRFRRTIHGEWGDYQLSIPHGAPVLLIGQREIDAFAPDLQAGSARELEILPAQLETVVRELCDKAVAAEFDRLQTEAADTQALKSEIEELRNQLGHAKQQIQSLLNPLSSPS